MNDTQIVATLVLKAESECALGNTERATDLLDKVLDQFGYSDATDVQRMVARSMVVHGEIVQTQGDGHLRATEILDEAINRFGGSDDTVIRVHVKSAWLNKGIAHGLLGDFEREIECYEQLMAWLDQRNALDEKPSGLTASLYKSRRLAELRRAEEALVSSQDSVERLNSIKNQFEPKIRQWIDWYIGGTRALALTATGESDIARDSFRCAYDTFDPCNHLHLGEMLKLVPELIAAGASERELVDVLQSNSSSVQRLHPSDRCATTTHR